MQKELTYLLFCGLYVWGLSGCSSPIKHKAEVPPISVRTMVIGAQEDAVAYTRYVGSVEAIQETPLSLQSAGRVTEVNVQEGSAVSSGQVLLRIDNTQAVNALRSAEAAWRQAEDGYTRAQQVYAKGAITEQQMVEIESKRTQAQALYEVAKRQVEECELKAPCKGVVSGLDIQIGQTIVPGVPLMKLLDLSAYAVRFTVPEGEISSLSIGQKGTVECTTMDTVLTCTISDKGIQANPRLTKGQYSPTSPKGFVSKSSPFGTVERPFIPAELVLGARGTFFARTLDVDMPTTVDCLVAAQQHKGCSIVECLVNCVIFNNGTHAWIADREQRAEHSIVLKHGEKMIFGANNDKGLAVEIDPTTFVPRIIVVPADDPRVLVHDAHQTDPTLHRLLALMGQDRVESVEPKVESDLPIALGVIRNVEAETYDQAVNAQINEVRSKAKAKTFDELTATLEQWTM